MKRLSAVVTFAGLVAGLAAATAQAQDISISRSSNPDVPFTLIYPSTMVASGDAQDMLTLNHPNAPLQCQLSIVPVEDTSWTAEDALATLDVTDVASGWAETFPGFSIGETGTRPYQDATALFYNASSLGSPMGVPLDIVHTETVANARGYVLDCLYDSSVEQQARPIVDFILSNFATSSDVEGPLPNPQ